jgi:pimeloyl-ACP methyl ester carboxylesterase
MTDRGEEGSMSEGMIDVHGGRVWYRTWGEGNSVPLLVMHGGPGWPSDYLHNMAALADERRVIVYDQLVSRALSSWVKCGMLCHGTNWTAQAGVGVE